MATTTQVSTINIVEAIDDAIKAKLHKEFDAIVEESVNNLVASMEDKRAELITQAALKVSRYFDIQQNQDRITISVDTRNRG